MTLLQKSSIFDSVDIKNPLQQASQSIGSTVSNLKNQTVNPFKSISSGVQAGVVKVSETASVISKNLSDYKSSAVDGINNSLKNITGGLYNLKDLGSLVTYQDGFKLDTDQLLSLAGKGIGFNVSSMQDLKNQIGNGFINELNSMTGGIASGLVIADTSGSFVKLQIADDWKYSMGTSLINFLGADDPDGFGTVLNVAAMNSVLNTLLNQSIQNGLTTSLDNFKNMYVYQSDYFDSLIDNTDVAAQAGNLEMLAAMIDSLDKDGVAKMSALYPNAIEDLLRSFYFTSTMDPSDYPRLTTDMLRVCVALKGEDWYKYPTQFGKVINVGLVSSISTDAKILLQTETDLIPLLCSAGVFTEQSATELFMTDFPTAVKVTS